MLDKDSSDDDTLTLTENTDDSRSTGDFSADFSADSQALTPIKYTCPAVTWLIIDDRRFPYLKPICEILEKFEKAVAYGGAGRAFARGDKSPPDDLDFAVFDALSEEELTEIFPDIKPSTLGAPYYVIPSMFNYRVDLLLAKSLVQTQETDMLSLFMQMGNKLTIDALFFYLNEEKQLILVDPTGEALQDIQEHRLSLISPPRNFENTPSLMTRVLCWLARDYWLDGALKRAMFLSVPKINIKKEAGHLVALFRKCLKQAHFFDCAYDIAFDTGFIHRLVGCFYSPNPHLKNSIKMLLNYVGRNPSSEALLVALVLPFFLNKRRPGNIYQDILLHLRQHFGNPQGEDEIRNAVEIVDAHIRASIQAQILYLSRTAKISLVNPYGLFQKRFQTLHNGKSHCGRNYHPLREVSSLPMGSLTI